MKNIFPHIVLALLLTYNSSFLFAVCNANYNYQETSPLHVEFINFSVSYNEGSVHYYWDFGDGSTSYQENPTHIYDAPGIYEVCLNVITTELCFSSKTKNLYIGIPPNSPYCYLDIDFITTNATAPNYNNGTATVYGYSDIPCCYEAFWSNGDEGEHIENLSPGTYCVSLTNGETCYGTNCVTIGYNNNCSSSFYIDSTTFSHLDGAYRFINNSHGEQHDFIWDFGDGTTSSAYSPLHIYRNTGTYNVCLTIETHYGCTDVFCRTLHVNYISPLLANLYGIVNAGETLLPQGIAVLYKYLNQEYTAIDFSFVENGYYTFESLPKDFLYLTHIIPYFDTEEIYFPKYNSTYFDNNVHWQQTSFINLYNDTVYNTSLYSYNDIYFNQGIISGKVTYEDTIAYEENIFQNVWFEISESNEGVAKNMVVLLQNSNHVLLDFNLTDENGSFTFNNLEYGGYFLSVEKPGLISDEIFVEISADNPYSNNNDFTIFENYISPVHKFISERHFDLYPNPAEDKLFLNLMEQNCQIKISNSLGNTIIQKSLNYGFNTINLSDFNPGLYFIEINSDKYTYKEKLIKL
ncbi:MAG TPA: DUF2012 domain-containing protein [Bacteroidales bacterium]|nr:DUF2012 domain-containing protein [Bacteroidales bacterium]